MVVLTLSVGCYCYISLSGFPTTFIIDMALSAPRFMSKKIRLPCSRGSSEVILMQLTDLSMFVRRLAMSLGTSQAYPNGSRCYYGQYHDGRAIYFYDDSADGRVYNGRLWFSKQYYNQLNGKVRETARGLYGNGMKQGLWHFNYRAAGISRSLAVEYADGHRAGTYMFCSTCRTHALGFNKGTTLVSVGMYGDRLQGPVSYTFNKESLSGSFDDDGRPDGEWVMDSAKSRSHRTFHETWSHGTCTSSYSFDVTTGEKIKVKGRLPDIVIGVIMSECRPLEHILNKGTK